MRERQISPKPAASPKTAMLLAAGLGTRMRPLTQNLPKPLVQVAGKTLLERGLDLLVTAGVEKVVINMHYLAAKLAAFVQGLGKTYAMELVLSDESEKLLDSAGGIIKALPLLGQDPFFVLNADTFWLETPESESGLRRLVQYFDPAQQDMLLLTLPYSRAPELQKGNFLQNAAGRLIRANKMRNNSRAVIYAGGLILNPVVFTGAEAGKPQSLNMYFDRAIAQKRLYGLTLQAEWHSIGSVETLHKTEASLQNYN